MAWPVTSDPVRFEEAEAWFRERIPMTDAQWLALEERWRAHAFTISNLAQLDMVHDAWQALREGLEQGRHLRETKEELLEQLQAHWGGTVKDPAFRLETIWRNATQTAYSRGRYEQMTHPDILAARPYWMFDAIVDGDETAICRERDGTIRLATDPWWASNYPPLHHRCRSGVRGLTAAEAERRGGPTSALPDEPPAEGWGRAPTETEYEPDPDTYPPELFDAYEAKRAARERAAVK